MRTRSILTVVSAVLFSSTAVFAADSGNWSGSVEGLSKYVCQDFAVQCSDDPVSQVSLSYDFGKDAIGTGGRNGANIWWSQGSSYLANELDVSFSDNHTSHTSLFGDIFWGWSAGYSWYNSSHGMLFAPKDDMLKLDTNVGKSFDLGSIAGIHITASPYVRLVYMRGLGMYADYTDVGINLPLHFDITKRWYATFFAARLWNTARYYDSPLQLTATVGYKLSDHWSVYAKYKGVKANSSFGGSYVDFASWGGGISFTGL